MEGIFNFPSKLWGTNNLNTFKPTSNYNFSEYANPYRNFNDFSPFNFVDMSTYLDGILNQPLFENYYYPSQLMQPTSANRTKTPTGGGKPSILVIDLFDQYIDLNNDGKADVSHGDFVSSIVKDDFDVLKANGNTPADVVNALKQIDENYIAQNNLTAVNASLSLSVAPAELRRITGIKDLNHDNLAQHLPAIRQAINNTPGYEKIAEMLNEIDRIAMLGIPFISTTSNTPGDKEISLVNLSTNAIVIAEHDGSNIVSDFHSLTDGALRGAYTPRVLKDGVDFNGDGDVDIPLSQISGGNYNFSEIHGTSFAAPFAAGLAAKMALSGMSVNQINDAFHDGFAQANGSGGYDAIQPFLENLVAGNRGSSPPRAQLPPVYTPAATTLPLLDDYWSSPGIYDPFNIMSSPPQQSSNLLPQSSDPMNQFLNFLLDFGKMIGQEDFVKAVINTLFNQGPQLQATSATKPEIVSPNFLLSLDKNNETINGTDGSDEFWIGNNQLSDAFGLNGPNIFHTWNSMDLTLNGGDERDTFYLDNVSGQFDGGDGIDRAYIGQIDKNGTFFTNNKAKVKYTKPDGTLDLDKFRLDDKNNIQVYTKNRYATLNSIEEIVVDGKTYTDKALKNLLKI